MFAVAGRLREGLPANEKNKVLSPKPYITDNGVSIYSLRRGKFSGSGVSDKHCRVATCTIKAPVDEVSSIWWNQASRKNWDKLCTESTVVKELGNNTIIGYVIGRPGYILPARDYAFTLSKETAGVAGVNDYSAVAFVAVDSPEQVPPHWLAVRGSVNSMLLLQQKGGITQATYVAEFSPAGWLPGWLVGIFADRFMYTLSSLKQEIEGAQDGADEASLSVEAAARQRFNRKLAQESERNRSSFSLLDNPATDLATLDQTIAIMEQKLEDIRGLERKEAIDMGELKARVAADLAKAKMRRSAVSKGS
jgi:hypothetical protein